MNSPFCGMPPAIYCARVCLCIFSPWQLGNCAKYSSSTHRAWAVLYLLRVGLGHDSCLLEVRSHILLDKVMNESE